MADEQVHPDTGADEDSLIWDNLQAADDAKSAGEEPPEPVTTEVPREEQTSTAQADIWSNASEEHRAAYEATRRQAEEVEQNYKRVSGTVSALQRQINELKARPATPAQAAATVNVLESPALKLAREEYPEVVGPLEDALRQISEQTTALNKQVTERFTTADQREANAYYAAQENALTAREPDWKVQTAKPEFKKWLDQQPQYVQEGIQRNGSRIVDAAEAADIVGRFKASIGATNSTTQATKRQAQLQSAAAPQGRSGQSKITSGPPDGTDAEIWAHWDREDARKAKSR